MLRITLGSSYAIVGPNSEKLKQKFPNNGDFSKRKLTV